MRRVAITSRGPLTRCCCCSGKGGSVQATVHPYGTIPPTDGDGFLHVAFFIRLHTSKSGRIAFDDPEWISRVS